MDIQKVEAIDHIIKTFLSKVYERRTKDTSELLKVVEKRILHMPRLKHTQPSV